MNNGIDQPASAPEANKVMMPEHDLAGILTDIQALKEDKSFFPDKINFDPDKVERGMAQLVLTVVELVYQLMERQALRRMDGGSLNDEQIERLGTAFMQIDACIEELTEVFGIKREDLNLDLGPLGNLL